jgi:hypothetical protein
MPTCSLCNKPSVARGLCRNHYYVERRRGKHLLRPMVRGAATLKERFDVMVDRSGECWNWTGHLSSGYGMIWLNRKAVPAHRVSYALNVGPIGDSYVLHRCDNRKCVRPDHLFLGTCRDNILDCVAKKRHAFGEKNGHVKLTKEQVAAIRSIEGSNTEIAARYSVHQCTISRIKSGKRRSLG